MSIYIVTPSYNAVQTIDQTILSVISQTGAFDLHYHIQDGGSNDGTVEKLKSWKERLGSTWKGCNDHTFSFSFSVDSDNGMYDAICRGFNQFEMKGTDWMGWINADDVLLNSALALLAQIDSQSKNLSDISWVCGAAATSRNGMQVVQTERVLNSDVISRGLCDGKHWGYVQQEGTFFRYRTWLAAGGEQAFGDHHYAGDWQLWINIAKHASIYQYKFPTGIFAIRLGQLSQVAHTDYLDEMESVVPVEKRTQRLKSLDATNLNAHYLVLDQQTEKIKVEQRSIAQHLEYRLSQYSAHAEVSKNKNKTSIKRKVTLPKLNYSPSQKPKKNQVERHGQVVVYDADWQYPAITEQYAFQQMRKLSLPNTGLVYLAFPWATLIDLLNRKKDSVKDYIKSLNECIELIKPYEKIVTVCQHILTLEYQNIFSEAGISHIFWSHATIEQKYFPKHSHIKISSFPLFPVQAVGEHMDSKPKSNRSILYSFIGARANNWYLTKSRNMILDNLNCNEQGLVTGRDEWHYNKIVYDHQINKKEKDSDHLICHDDSEEFKQVMQDSVFSLCPSGSGPNSIRLWESIGFGSIPVILSDTHLLPGNFSLWQEAAVFCPEELEAIKLLPKQLSEIKKDTVLLQRKRHALKQLWILYGPDCFIYDLQKIFLFNQCSHGSINGIKKTLDYESLMMLAENITNSKDELKSHQLSPFLLGCSVRALTDPENLLKQFKSHPKLKNAYKIAMQYGSKKHKDALAAILSRKGVSL